jgi:hypothetical protein
VHLRTPAQLKALKEWKYLRRIDADLVYRRRRCQRHRGVGLWFISVQIDLKRLLDRRGGTDSAIETYLRVPDLIYRSNSTAIGEEVELTFEERVSLRITSLRPSDVPWRRCRRLYKLARNHRKRERARALRRQRGAIPHSVSLAQTKPWETDGISRATWFRRQKNRRETDSCRHLINKGDATLSSLTAEIPHNEPEPIAMEKSMIPIETVSKEAKRLARKASKAANEAHRASQVEQLPADIRILMKERGASQDDPLASPFLAERVAELEETVSVLSADNEILEAENRLFEDMKAQWQAGGFAAVIDGKNEEIRALLVRVASESREKAKNFRSAEYWKAEAIKLGYRRNGEGEKTK